MKKYNEAIQAKLTHYIKRASKDGRALWVVVRLNDEQIVGWYSTRSQAFDDWKRFNAASGRNAQPATGRKTAKKRKVVKTSRAARTDIWNRGYRMPGSGWAGRSQR
jgi:hypothetical protein